jgi:hypothetical protein
MIEMIVTRLRSDRDRTDGVAAAVIVPKKSRKTEVCDHKEMARLRGMQPVADGNADLAILVLLLLVFSIPFRSVEWHSAFFTFFFCR